MIRRHGHSGRPWSQIGAGLRVLGLAAVLAVVAQPGGTHAPELHGFKMVAFEPPVPAPAIELPDIAAVATSLAAYRGRYVLLNFWATWCAPCVREMPSLQKLEDALGQEVLSVVAVSVDRAGEESKVKAFTARMALRFKVMLDSKGVAQGTYGARELPSTFLINPAGEIVAAAKGERDWASDEAISYLSEIVAGR